MKLARGLACGARAVCEKVEVDVEKEAPRVEQAGELAHQLRL